MFGLAGRWEMQHQIMPLKKSHRTVLYMEIKTHIEKKKKMDKIDCYKYCGISNYKVPPP